MKMIKRVLFIISCSIMISYGSFAHAATAITPCSTVNSIQTYSFGDFNLDPSLENGAVISTIGLTNLVTCNSKSYYNTLGYFISPSSANIDYGLSDVTDVMKTAYSGIGLKWRNYSANANSWKTFTSLNNSNENRGLDPNTTKQLIDELSLVKIGDIEPGIYPSQNIEIRFGFNTSSPANSGYTMDYVAYTLTIPSFTVNVKGCTVDTSNINVNMGLIHRSLFSGVGSTAGGEDFSIDLQCNKQTPVWYTLAANNGVNGSTQNVANLTSDSTATGVGVQIFDQNSTIINFGEANYWTETSSTSSQAVSIPLTAKYYQTESNITAGSANSSVTFTITYQ